MNNFTLQSPLSHKGGRLPNLVLPKPAEGGLVNPRIHLNLNLNTKK